MFKINKDYKIHKEKVQKSDKRKIILSNKLFRNLNMLDVNMHDGWTYGLFRLSVNE